MCKVTTTGICRPNNAADVSPFRSRSRSACIEFVWRTPRVYSEFIVGERGVWERQRRKGRKQLATTEPRTRWSWRGTSKWGNGAESTPRPRRAMGASYPAFFHHYYHGCSYFRHHNSRALSITSRILSRERCGRRGRLARPFLSSLLDSSHHQTTLRSSFYTLIWRRRTHRRVVIVFED